jgi:transposase
MRMLAVDELVSAEHPVRAVWLSVCRMDLTAFYAGIQAVEGGVGRDAVDPRILLCLWLQATIEGIGSARELTRRCDRDPVYQWICSQWICGGVGVNRDLLSDFRCAHPKALDAVMTDTIGLLLQQDLVSLKRVAQDGMRVRASAGKGSFRRQATLEKHLQAARQQVEQMRQLEDRDEDSEEEDQSGPSKRQRSAQKRAAEERLARIEQALKEHEQLQARREKRKTGDGASTRCSTTDPEARNMKMPDGGYRPAMNVQFATTCGSRVIVGVDVTNAGADGGLMTPMADRIEAAFGVTPDEYLVDGGFNSREDITQMEQRQIKVFAPVKQEQSKREAGRDPYARQRDDTDEYFAWRQRMSTDAAKAIYKERCSTAEFPNAGCRNRGLHQFCVRGIQKCRTLSVWQAVAHNLQMIRCHDWLPRLLAAASTAT